MAEPFVHTIGERQPGTEKAVGVFADFACAFKYADLMP